MASWLAATTVFHALTADKLAVCFLLSLAYTYNRYSSVREPSDLPSHIQCRNQRISGITLIASISLIAVTWLLACLHIPAFSVNERKTKRARDGRGAVVPSSQLGRTFILQGELTSSYNGISRSNSRQACRLLSMIVSLYVQPIFFGSWAFWFTFPHIP